MVTGPTDAEVSVPFALWKLAVTKTALAAVLAVFVTRPSAVICTPLAASPAPGTAPFAVTLLSDTFACTHLRRARQPPNRQPQSARKGSQNGLETACMNRPFLAHSEGPNFAKWEGWGTHVLSGGMCSAPVCTRY